MAVSVLIAEDDHNIAELLQMYLEKEGYAVTVAADGGQGLSKFRAIKPDLVLLDVMMPVMDGWSVCRAIRAESQTPVIMLTAKGETDDKVSGLKNGADDYITKPFEMKEVLARIEAVLRRSTGAAAENVFYGLYDTLTAIRSFFNNAKDVQAAVEKAISENAGLRKQVEDAVKERMAQFREKLVAEYAFFYEYRMAYNTLYFTKKEMKKFCREAREAIF